MSGLINKVKDAMHSNKDSTNQSTYDNPQSTNAGPHGSNIVNKGDPRIDSDRDGRNNPTSRTGGLGQTQTGYGQDPTVGAPTTESAVGQPGGGLRNDATGIGGYGHNQPDYGTNDPTTGISGTPAGASAVHKTPASQYDNPRSANEGPHKSNLMNKMDPRVDSDRDNRNDPTSRAGGYGQTQTGYGNTGYDSGNTGYGQPTTGHGNVPAHHSTTVGGAGGYNTSSSQYDNPRSTNEGPHSSKLMNKGDPRVDSDRDHRNDPTSRTGGYGQTQTGYDGGAGYGQTHTGHGAGGYGDSTTASGNYGAGQTGVGAGGYASSATPGSGKTSKTAGPHNSDLMNKLDPRVDADM